MTKLRQKRNTVTAKVHPNAISIRSGTVGTTMLFDESFRTELSKYSKCIFSTIAAKKPSKHNANLARWAREGKLLVIDSHPEIADGDGVPNLDLVLANPKLNSPPKEGVWYDPINRWIDLPSGVLRIEYDDSFAEKRIRTILSKQEVEDWDDEAESYLVHIKPGFYRASIFTRFMDDKTDDEEVPELAVYLTQCQRPKQFELVPICVPIHPADQDVYALTRKAAGLGPLSKRIREHQPKLLKNGAFRGRLVNHEIFDLVLEMPVECQSAFGLQAGQLVRILMQGDSAELHAAVAPKQGFCPTVWDELKKIKRASPNFATLHLSNNLVRLEMMKRSRNQPFELPEHEMALFTMTHINDETSGSPKQVPLSSSNQGQANTVTVPRNLGQPGDYFNKLIPMIELCDSWTQAILFEVKGQLLVGAVKVFPPKLITDVNGKQVSMAAEITGTIGVIQGENIVDENPKSFRGFPDGVARAMKWIAKNAKGGRLWTNRFETQANMFHGKSKLRKKDANRAAMDAWYEILGMSKNT